MKRGTPDHPKTRALARMLRINHAWAVGILEMLWHFAAQYAPAGDIGRYSDDEIVEACGWPSDRAAEELIEALIACRWLDRHEEHRLLVHDWSEHADATVHYRLAKARARFADGKIPSLDGLYSSERKAALEAYRSSDKASPRDCHGGHRGVAEEATRESHGANHGDTMALPRRIHGGTTAPPRRNHGDAMAAPRHRHGMPEPKPLPEPEPAAAYVNSRIPPNPRDGDSPPPLTSRPVGISPQAPAADRPPADESPPLAQAGSKQPGKAPPLPADPRAAVQVLARRRSMDSGPPASRDGPRDERSLAIAVVGQMLSDWMEHRAAALGPPDEALCKRLLELHGWQLDSVAVWLKALRRRSKHPGSVQSWGWFLHLAECDLRRPAAAAVGGAN